MIKYNLTIRLYSKIDVKKRIYFIRCILHIIIYYNLLIYYIVLHYMHYYILHTHTHFILHIDNFINIFLHNYIIQWSSVCDYLK